MGDGSDLDEIEQAIEEKLRRAADRVDTLEFATDAGTVSARRRKPKKSKRKSNRSTEVADVNPPSEGSGFNSDREDEIEQAVLPAVKFRKVVRRSQPHRERDGLKDSSEIEVVDARSDPYARPSRGTGSAGDSGTMRSEVEGPTRHDFIVQSRKEVAILGSSQFTGKKKKDWEQQRLADLGARKPKSQKMPLTMLKGIRKAAKKRAVKERDDLRAAKIVSHSRRKRK